MVYVVCYGYSVCVGYVCSVCGVGCRVCVCRVYVWYVLWVRCVCVCDIYGEEGELKGVSGRIGVIWS